MWFSKLLNRGLYLVFHRTVVFLFELIFLEKIPRGYFCYHLTCMTDKCEGEGEGNIQELPGNWRITEM